MASFRLHPGLVAAVCLLPLEAVSQRAGDGPAPWRSALYPETWRPEGRDPEGRFLHDFSHAGYHAGLEPIPVSPPGPVVDATQAPYGADATGRADATGAIQRALDAVGEAGGGVVQLPAGTYLLSFPQGQGWALRIRHPRTVLRGAGRDRTFLECTSTRIRGGNAILVQPDAGSVFGALPDSSRPLAVDAGNGATVVFLTRVDGLAVGDRVVLRSDWTQEFIDEHGMRDIWRPSPGRTGPLFFRRLRAIDAAAKSVTLDTPLRYPLKTRDLARLHLCAPFLREVGIEDLAVGNREHPAAGWSLGRGGKGWGDNELDTVGTPAYDVHGSHLIRFRHVWDGWLRRVDTHRPKANKGDVHALSNIVILHASRHITVTECSIGRTQYNGGGGNGYGFTLQDANDCLVTRCEVVATRHNYDFKCAGSNGNVVHRSISRAPRLPSDFHMYLSMGNLLDCMVMDGDFLESRFRPWGSAGNRHGHAGTQNVFWNTYGTAARKDKVVESRQFGHGYVIGTRGPTHAVVLDPMDRRIDTSPVDWSEGIGKGDALRPESLYEDQLARRVALVPRIGGLPVSESSHESAHVLCEPKERVRDATLFWGERDGGMMPEAWEHRAWGGELAASPPGAFLAALSPETVYHCRWFARNEHGVDWADQTVRFATRRGPAIREAGAELASTVSGTFRARLLGTPARVTLHWGLADGRRDPASWEHAVGPLECAVGDVAFGPVDLPALRPVFYRWRAQGEGLDAWSPRTVVVDTTPVLTVADIAVAEGAGAAEFVLVLSPASAVDTTVRVATEDGTARPGRAYQALGVTAIVPAGQTRASVIVKLLDNRAAGPYARRFRLLLADPRNARLGTSHATCRILDDDLPPLPISRGLVLRLDASGLANEHADGDFVAAWPDGSGQGHDATADREKPRWLERGIGEHPAIGFDQIAADLVVPAIRPENGPVSAYVVSAKEEANGSLWQRLLACENGGPNDWTAPNWSMNPPRGEAGAPQAYPARIDSLRIAEGVPIGPLRIGRQGTTASGWFLGRIGEILVYDRQLDVAEDAKVQAWLRAKYAIGP